MGLEFVELVMTLEQEYDIDIENHDLEGVRTVRQLWTVVATKTQMQPILFGPEWDHFCELVAQDLGLPRALVVSDADLFVNLHID